MNPPKKVFFENELGKKRFFRENQLPTEKKTEKVQKTKKRERKKENEKEKKENERKIAAAAFFFSFFDHLAMTSWTSRAIRIKAR